MGGLKPGAGSALAKAIGSNAGAAQGALPSSGTSGHTVTATLWHSWQLEQVVWPSHGPDDVAPCAWVVPLPSASCDTAAMTSIAWPAWAVGPDCTP